MSTGESTFVIPDDVKALIPESKQAAIVQAFTQMDANQDGKVELDEYLNFALAQERERLTQKFKGVDADGDGCIEFEEFVAAAEPSFRILQKFRELDIDQNGLLSVDEAIAIAHQLVLPLSSQQVQAIITKADHDGDGQVTYYEYLGAIAQVGFQ
ncbi:MAG: EF-hand domain-containing protein [Elainellaceae cyanobacterium]